MNTTEEQYDVCKQISNACAAFGHDVTNNFLRLGNIGPDNLDPGPGATLSASVVAVATVMQLKELADLAVKAGELE